MRNSICKDRKYGKQIAIVEGKIKQTLMRTGARHESKET